MSKELVEVSLHIYHMTERAYLVWDGVMENEDGGPKKQWVPKSQCELDVEENAVIPGKVYTLTMPRWLFEEKEFVA